MAIMNETQLRRIIREEISQYRRNDGAKIRVFGQIVEVMSLNLAKLLQQ
jgi:hypothetical protein